MRGSNRPYIVPWIMSKHNRQGLSELSLDYQVVRFSKPEFCLYSVLNLTKLEKKLSCIICYNEDIL